MTPSQTGLTRPHRPLEKPAHTPAFWGAGALLFAGLLCYLFSGILFGGDQFGYRDAGYYHYPFAKQIVRETSSGRIPLWDPYENLGVPLAGNPAAAVFYPVRILSFSLVHAGVSFDVIYRVYILIHLAVAFTAFVYLARTRLSGGTPLTSRTGALFGALAWTFGGHILFQTTNAPFLIGASWLPLMTGAHLRILMRPSLNPAVAAALAAALMITGGDPQTALFGTLLFIPLFLLTRNRQGENGGFRQTASCRCVFFSFGCSVLLGLALAAVQVIPAAETALHSSRVPRPQTADAEKQADEMAIYNFSVPPWRTAEFFWHDIGGREFPENSRWFSALAGDRQLWAPSLYMGLFPILAALSAFRFRLRRGRGERASLLVFATYLALLALAASWGIYGLGWLGRFFAEPGNLPKLQPRWGDQTGGVYWILTHLIPGWSAFRYPAKMMTFAALALSLLSGLGYDRYFERLGRRRSVSKRLFLLFFISVLGWAGTRWGTPARLFDLLGITANSVKTIYGPLSISQGMGAAAAAFAQTALLSLLLLASPLLLRTAAIARRREAVFALAALLVLSFDLAAAQKWMVRGVGAAAYSSRSPIAARLHADTAGRADPPRLFRDSKLYPASFFQTSSPGRLGERLLWDRLTLFQKDAEEEGIANLDVRGTFVPAEYLTVSRYLRSELARWKRSGSRGAGLDRLLAALGADALLAAAGGIRFDRIPNGGNRVHIIHHPDCYGEWQDLVRHDLNEESLPGESAKIVRYTPAQLEIEADLQQPGTLLIAEQFWPGWKAKRTAEAGIADTENEHTEEIEEPLPVYRLASIERAVDLPAGRSRIVMEYRPCSFRIGAVMTIAALLAMMIGLARGTRRLSASEELKRPFG